MHVDDLTELQEEFAGIDLNNKVQVREWFLSYPELTSAEFRCITSLTEDKLSKIRHWAGADYCTTVEVPGGLIRTGVRKVSRQSTIFKGWRGEWLRTHYVDKKLSITAIAKIINRSRTAVRNQLIKQDLLRPYEPANCYTKEWLDKHYTESKWSIRECAKVAGVCYATMRRWLVRFNIVMRDPFEASDATILGQKTSQHSQAAPNCNQGQAQIEQAIG